MNDLLTILLQYSNSDLGYDEASYKERYWILLILIIIGAIYYFKFYLPCKKEEENQKLQKRKRYEVYFISEISKGIKIPFFAFDEKSVIFKYGYSCPVCFSIPGCHSKHEYYYLDNDGRSSKCGFDVRMIPKNTDGTYTIELYKKDKDTFERMTVKDFNFIKIDYELSDKAIKKIQERGKCD